MLGVEVGKIEEAWAVLANSNQKICKDVKLVAKYSEGIAILTTSKPLPLNIRSVVATTFPPFRCKSHMILLLGTCGNICCIRSTSASRARTLLALLRFEPEEPLLDPEKNKYRTANAPTRIMMRSCGRLTV